MSFLFFIFISFLCPFVSAQVSDDYAQEAFSGYIDVVIGLMVPLFVFLFVSDESGEYMRALIISAIYFLIVGCWFTTRINFYSFTSQCF